MRTAGWFPADPITLASSVRIAADTVLHKSDDDAPVSNLFLFGRKQDLAFEQPVGGGPRQRHHVRFWLWDELYEGRPGWFGAATFDKGWASATRLDRSRIISPPMWMRSATAFSSPSISLVLRVISIKHLG